VTAAPRPWTAVVGLRREREVLTVALAAGRHVVIEGPPGTGKSTLLREIARDTGQDLVFVEGNAELTPARLVGQHDPAQVLAQGYAAASFTDGPLLTAMRGGALLYLEEFNRIPEETLNVLITVLAEGEIAVPRLGLVAAGPGFRLIAAMNPFDAVGTARVSQAIADRICRVVLGYQDAAAEREITAAVTGEHGRVAAFAVALTRTTREHPDVRMGASVRGAIDLVLLVAGLGRLRGERGLTLDTARDAAYAALSGRIRIADGCDRSPESVIDELLARVWADWPGLSVPGGERDGTGEPDGTATDVTDGTATDGAADDSTTADSAAADSAAGDSATRAGRGKADGPAAGPPRAGPPGGRSVSASRLRRDRAARPGPASIGRAELAARHAALRDVSPEAGALDSGALRALLADDPDAAVALLADLALATDRELRAAARRLAARVFVELAAAGGRPARGTRRLQPGRADGDLDLDRTLARLPGAWPPPPEDLVTATWGARQRALCLLIDTSGSMSGHGVAIAAVAAAGVALAADHRLEPAVLAFGREVTVLQARASARPAQELVGALVGLRGHGLTDLAGALRAAAGQLAGADAGERVTILLSDCLPTTGGDPAAALAGTGRLQVLCPRPSAQAAAAGVALARRGGGLCQPVTRLAEVAPALSRALSR
jgi:magnesium chelatase subunit D